jgi:hypothetical protein
MTDRDPSRQRTRKEDLVDLPDVRDGLTRLERVILFVLEETERERGGASVPTTMLYGRVLELIDVSREELLATLQRLIGARSPRPR